MDLEILTRQVAELAITTGAFIREEALKFTPDKIEYKGLNDLVSYVDKQAEHKLVAGLTTLLPVAGYITEEKTIDKTAETFNWIIDPLDGTTNFIHGIPTFAVSIALQENDELVLGVVYEVNRDECFYAWKGGGAYLNGNSISVSKTSSVDKTLLATGFPYYDFEKQEPFLKVFKELMQKCHGLRRIGSAAVDLAYVACGRFDGYFEYNLNSYDIAGGVVLVKEAGGEVCNFKGGKELFIAREIVATNALITEEILKVLNTHFN